MLTHSGLPTYYFGLTSENTRGEAPTRRSSPFAGSLVKIPFADEPKEFTDRYLLSLNVSGVDPHDVAVVLYGRDLHIEVEKEFNPNKLATSRWDKAYGIFMRNFELPRDVNSKRIFYSVYNGILSIEIFKEITVSEEVPTEKRSSSEAPLDL